MEKRLLSFVFLLPTLLSAQTLPIFDVFYDQTTAFCHTIVADTIWVGGKGVLMKRLCPDGELLHIWDGNNSPLKEEVRDIALQPSTGRIWLALGAGGVALKQGNSWQFWTAEEVMGDTSMSAPQVHHIGVDSSEQVWALDPGSRRLNYYKNGVWTATGLSPDEIGYNVKRLINDPAGGLWWINDKGAHHYADGLVTHRMVSGAGICDAQFRSDGQLIVATTDKRVLRILPSGTSVLIAKWSDEPFWDCVTLGLDKEEKIYLATKEEVLKLTATGWEKSLLGDPFPIYIPSEINIDRYNNVWMSYFSDKLSRLSNNKVSKIYSGIVGGQNVQSDDSGNVWFCGSNIVTRHHASSGVDTHYEFNTGAALSGFAPGGLPHQIWLASAEGLHLFDGAAWQLFPDAASGIKQQIYKTGTGTDGEVLGFGFDNNSNSVLKIFRPTKQTWEHYPLGQNGVPTDVNRSPSYAQDGKLWYSGFSGISNYFKGQWTTLNPANSGMPFPTWHLVAATPDNNVWVSRRDSLYRYDGITWSFALKIPCADGVGGWSHVLRGLFVDSRGWLWVTKDCASISMYDGSEWQHFNAQNSNLPPDKDVSNITEDSAGDIWFSADPAIRLRTQSIVGATEATRGAFSNILVWPNPVRDELTVALPTSASGLLEIADMQGHVLQRRIISETQGAEVQVPRSNLPAGLYFIRFLEASGRQQVQKVVFE